MDACPQQCSVSVTEERQLPSSTFQPSNAKCVFVDSSLTIARTQWPAFEGLCIIYHLVSDDTLTSSGPNALGGVC